MINPVIIHSCKYSANPEQNNERIPLAYLTLDGGIGFGKEIIG